MAEPARKIDPVYDEEDQQPVIRPSLTPLQGGGESAPRSSGHLSAVPENEEPETEEEPDEPKAGASGRHLSSVPTGDKAKPSDTPEELAAAEQAGDEALQEDEANQIGEGYKEEEGKGGRRGRLSYLRRRRKLFFTGGLIAGLIGMIFSIISFLLPFKLTHIISSIEQRVGAVPEYAVERRLEFYMSRYFMMRRLVERGATEAEVRNRFIYMGDGFFDTLYTNWRGAKLESTMIEKYGAKVTTNLPNSEILGKRYLQPTDWTIEFTRSGQKHNLGNSKEMRAFIKGFTRNEVHPLRIIKRYHTRKILKKYFGVNNWKLFEKQRDKARKAYHAKKKALKEKMIKQTVGRISDRYSKWMLCLLNGKEDCKAIRKGEVPSSSSDDVTNDEGEIENGGEESRRAAENGVDGIDTESADEFAKLLEREAAGEITDKVMADEAAKVIRKVGLKKVLASFALGIGIIDTISQIVKSIDDGALNIVVYDKNAQQYAPFAAAVRSINDQTNSGDDFDPEDLRAIHEVYNGFEQSPVYQAGRTSSGSVSAAGGIRRDCNNDGDTTDNEDLLEEGETVCPNKRLVQDNTAFTNSSGWQLLSKLNNAWRSTFGKIVGAFTTIVNTALDVTGLDTVIQRALDATGVSGATTAAFGEAIDWVVGPSACTGAEVGPEAYDCLHGGMAITASSFGGGVGENREDTIGGPYLSDQQVQLVRAEQKDYHQYELKNQSFFARYFSPANSESLTGRLAMHAPTSLSDVSRGFARLLTKPFAAFGSLGRLWQQPVSAGFGADNPFHVIYYGYSVEQLDELEKTEPDELRQKYHCDTPVADRPQNSDSAYGRPTLPNGEKMPFDVALEADPCLLEERVIEAGSLYFTGEYNRGIDDAPAAEDPPPGGGDTSKLQFPPNLGTADDSDLSQNVYVQMPVATNGEYLFYEKTCERERWGNRNLTGFLYTVAINWKAKHSDNLLKIGDLNANNGEHNTHLYGIGVDLYTQTGSANDTRLPNFSAAEAIELGKLMLDTGIVADIWFHHAEVVAALKEYARENNLPYDNIRLEYLVDKNGKPLSTAHKNHFHVNINDKKGPKPPFKPQCPKE